MPFLEQLSPEMMNDLYKELGTNELFFQKDSESLMRWMEEQPHLPNYNDLDFFKNMLIRCKNRMEKAKKHLEKYFTSKSIFVDMYYNHDVTSESFRKYFMTGYQLPLPKLTPDGQRVIITHIDCKNNSNMMASSKEYINGAAIMALISLRFALGRQSIFIIDLENVSAAYVSMIFTSIKKILLINTDLIPGRWSKIYFLNMIPALKPILSMAENFSDDFKNRLIVLNIKKNSMAEIISKDVLPEEYGGTERPLDELKKLWFEELKTFNPWLEQESKYYTDLKKTPSNVSNLLFDGNDAEFGVEGTFRRINID